MSHVLPYSCTSMGMSFITGWTTLWQLFVGGAVEQDGRSSVISDYPAPAAPVTILLPAVDGWLVLGGTGSPTWPDISAEHQIAVVEALAAGVGERTEYMSGCYSFTRLLLLKLWMLGWMREPNIWATAIPCHLAGDWLREWGWGSLRDLMHLGKFLASPGLQGQLADLVVPANKLMPQ